MLSDEQVDQLEHAISSSTLNDLPSLLTRLIPALFSELRLTRDAMRERTEEFLEAANKVRRPNNDSDSRAATDSRGVSVGPQHQPVSIAVSELPQITGQVPADSGRAHTKAKKATRRNAKRGRKAGSNTGDTPAVDAGGEGEEVGGPLRDKEVSREL